MLIEPNRGARVAELTELEPLFELRTALEVEAARLALERHDGRMPKPVHDAVRLMDAVCAQPHPPWSAVVEAHAAVHRAIVEAADSPRILRPTTRWPASCTCTSSASARRSRSTAWPRTTTTCSAGSRPRARRRSDVIWLKAQTACPRENTHQKGRIEPLELVWPGGPRQSRRMSGKGSRGSSLSRASARSATLAVALPEQLIAGDARAPPRHAGPARGRLVHARLNAAPEKLRRCRPRIVVVDPAVGGADDAASVLGQLRRASAETRIVVLCQGVDCDLAHAVVGAGVSAVIPTSSHFDDVLRTIADVAEGRTSFPASVLAGLNAPRENHGLSRRQIEVLEQLAAGRSRTRRSRAISTSRPTR